MSGEVIEARVVDAVPDTPSAGKISDSERKANEDHHESNNNDDLEIKNSKAPTGATNTNTTTQPPQSPTVLQNHYYVYPHIPQSPAPVPAGYDIQTLLMHQHVNRPGYSTVLPPPPLSPPTAGASVAKDVERTNISMGIIPPASPLFPAYSMEQQMEARGMAPPSPAPYLAAHQAVPTSPGMFYQGYGAAMSTYGGSPTTGEVIDSTASPDQQRVPWNDRPGTQQQPVYQNQTSPSPHLQSHLQYPSISTGRIHASSFDEILPPTSAKEYAEASPSRGDATLLTQQAWGGGGYNNTELYSQTLSPQPVQHREMGMAASNSRSFHSFYPPTTPGPPIQMTPHNKGPDGANLFIFHIPNHFTNLDMFHLFCHYGNLLSVRIMVEKDTGRSRGFGFVSYDSPDSAAVAIKELNGFVIGNKRLKVQHKQIRASDSNYNNTNDSQQAYTQHKNEGQMHITDHATSYARTTNQPLFGNFQASSNEQHIQNDQGSIKSETKTNPNPGIGMRLKEPLSDLDRLKEALPE